MSAPERARPSGSVETAGTVALMVLAHGAPRTLEALAAAFADCAVRMYVHLDSKVDLDAYCLGRSWPANLAFIRDRRAVYWGGFSMIAATEALAREAMQDARHVAFALVSDDTLPLVAPELAVAELLARPNRIDVGLSRRNPPFLRRYTEWFYMDSGATSARPMDVGQRHIDRPTLDAMARLARLQVRGKFPFPEVWGGSQWWSLSRGELEFALSELATNAWLRESFEFSAVPDELAFQTIYANRQQLTARSFTGPMLTDMTRSPAPFVFGSAEDIPPAPPGKLFVRKFADDSAAKVMHDLGARWRGPSGD